MNSALLLRVNRPQTSAVCRRYMSVALRKSEAANAVDLCVSLCLDGARKKRNPLCILN